MKTTRENGEVWVDALERLIAPGVAQFPVLPEHWIHGWDEGFSFCEPCAQQKIAELLKEKPEEEYLLDGGWIIEGDSMASCDTCGAALDNSFTDYAVRQELDHFLEYGFELKAPADCYSMQNILFASIFEGGEHSTRLQELTRRIIAPLGRAMSFSLTTPQYLNQTKTVTRRLGWLKLQPGQICKGVEKAQGLKRGEKLQVLGQHVVTAVRRERLDRLTKRECVAEGFPHLRPAQFIELFCRANRCLPEQEVTRIEFEYLWTKADERSAKHVETLSDSAAA